MQSHTHLQWWGVYETFFFFFFKGSATSRVRLGLLYRALTLQNFRIFRGHRQNRWVKKYILKQQDSNAVRPFEPFLSQRCTVLCQIYLFCKKVIEIIVLSQINEHLNHNKLLSPLQSSHRPNHNTETVLLRIINDLLTAMDNNKNNKICSLILLDLSAAFDTTAHHILLTRRQHSFGISGSALSWFSSYLCNRTHAITINSLQS